jgi:hypothetical protein
MIVHIDKKERDAVARCCAETSIPCEFFTMENNPGMLAVEIGNDEPKVIWSLARLVQIEMENVYQKALKERENKL